MRSRGGPGRRGREVVQPAPGRSVGVAAVAHPHRAHHLLEREAGQRHAALAAGQRIPDSDDEEGVHASGRDDGGE